MDRKPGFFTTLKEDVIRGLSPSRSRPRSPARSRTPMSNLFSRRKTRDLPVAQPEPLMTGRSSGNLVRSVEVLSPLMEGPDQEDGGDSRMEAGKWGQWMRKTPLVTVGEGFKRSDLRLLLGVLGAPLAPVHVSTLEPLPHLSIKDTPIESSSAQYILQQYVAASGGQRIFNFVHNAYAMGKVRMIASEFKTAKASKGRNSSRAAESGGFVLWQMNPDMWFVELALGGSKVHAGCNGKIVWRHTPWLGPHAAKGPVRPLRRALQGLDPRTTASTFANARCIGEKKINGDDCFILKVCADPAALKARSEGPAETIRHVSFGYFSQKTGLLVHLEDSHLTRIQNNGGEVVYWETTINSFLDDYKPVDGIMIAHSGRSVATLLRFGDTAMSHTTTRMEEAWLIEEVAFNVPGLSMDCFIPPAELRFASMGQTRDLFQSQKVKPPATGAVHCNKVPASGRSQDN